MVECKEQWRQIVYLEHTTQDAVGEFLKSCSEHAVDLIRESLRTGDPERSSAFRIAHYLSLEHVQELLPDLVSRACQPSYVPTISQARGVLMMLPRKWLLEYIEVAAEPLLRAPDEWIYRRLLELYAYLDRELTLKLAHRVAEHTDADIREAGKEFLNDPNPP